MWIIEQMRYPTDQLTNQRTQPVRGALLHLKKIHWEVQNGMTEINENLLENAEWFETSRRQLSIHLTFVHPLDICLSS